MVGRPPRQKAKNDARQQLCFSCIKSADNVADLFTRHGAERYTGYLEFMFYGYHLDRAIPRIPEAVYCLTPSLHFLLLIAQRLLMLSAQRFLSFGALHFMLLSALCLPSLSAQRFGVAKRPASSVAQCAAFSAAQRIAI